MALWHSFIDSSVTFIGPVHMYISTQNHGLSGVFHSRHNPLSLVGVVCAAGLGVEHQQGWLGVYRDQQGWLGICITWNDCMQ